MSKLVQLLRRRSSPLLTPKVTEKVSDVLDSDSEDGTEVQPENAYEQLMGSLQADMPWERAAKRMKTDTGTGNTPANTSSTPGIAGKGNEAENRKAEVQSSMQRQAPLSAKVARHEGAAMNRQRQRKGRQAAEQQEDDTVGPSSSMMAHFNRELSESDIAAMREAKLTKDSNAGFSEAWPDAAWLTTGGPLPEVHSFLLGYGIRQRLVGLWRDAHPSQADACSDFVDTQQSAFLALCRSYKDILYPGYRYPTSADEPDTVMDAALLHCLDHIAATSQRIKRNNDALKADPDADVPRDQGFTRAKVLILLPMRHQALKVVTRLLELAQKETRTDSVHGKARFLADFGLDAEDAAAVEAGRKPWQPAEHAALFAGNTEDHFRMGIKITRGQIRLFADFFQSDIIVASPIALATRQAEAEADAPEELDFLASVEIVVAARCDAFLMQNWAHLVTVFEALNGLPKDMHGGDIMRVFDWYLAGHGKHYRQSILLSSFVSPEMNALFSRLCLSHAGKAKLQLAHPGVINQVGLQLHHIFERVAAHAPAEEADRRFEHFKARIWPRIRDSGSGGQMIFVSSYFDYVRLRNFLTAQEVEFEGLSEYASGSEVARGRHRFAAGITRIAVYTERAHFYHRRRTRGVKDLYVYQLPEHAHFYSDLAQQLTTAEGIQAGHATATVLFSKFDALRLERVVGSSRAKKMLKGATGTFLFT